MDMTCQLTVIESEVWAAHFCNEISCHMPSLVSLRIIIMSYKRECSLRMNFQG